MTRLSREWAQLHLLAEGIKAPESKMAMNALRSRASFARTGHEYATVSIEGMMRQLDFEDKATEYLRYGMLAELAELASRSVNDRAFGAYKGLNA